VDKSHESNANLAKSEVNMVILFIAIKFTAFGNVGFCNVLALLEEITIFPYTKKCRSVPCKLQDIWPS
jgi:hypothetical protein